MGRRREGGGEGRRRGVGRGDGGGREGGREEREGGRTDSTCKKQVSA